ncbi:MAG TPA: hypothetical protein EYP22_06520 [Methanosarcinales archaeon]|nr:hypothetical protein [Methanosarcinales archaeon]
MEICGLILCQQKEKLKKDSIFTSMPLVQTLESEVIEWSNNGWDGVTQTTYDLLSYWFDRDEEFQKFCMRVFRYCKK